MQSNYCESRVDRVTVGTTDKGDRCWWNRWIDFLRKCELDNDVFLRQFTPHQRQLLLGAFAQKAWECEWSVSAAKGYGHLVVSTCRAAMDAVCQCFVSAGFDNPGKDSNGNLAYLLQMQLRGYKNKDPLEHPQNTIPFGLLQKLITMPTTEDPLRKRFHQLSHVAFFFPMLSSEYLSTSGTRRMRPIRLCDISFRNRFNRVIPHDANNLDQAESVSVTFRFQKRDIRDDTIEQSRSGNALFCPVVACATLVRQMLQDGNSQTDYVYRFRQDNGTFSDLNSRAALVMLRQFLWNANSVLFDVMPEECSLHSLRSLATTAMYLHGVPLYTIMLLGRWPSDAFQWYMRKQVTEFSKGVSRRMIQHPLFLPRITRR